LHAASMKNVESQAAMASPIVAELRVAEPPLKRRITPFPSPRSHVQCTGEMRPADDHSQIEGRYKLEAEIPHEAADAFRVGDTEHMIEPISSGGFVGLFGHSREEPLTSVVGMDRRVK